jgi:hypothetical protein
MTSTERIDLTPEQIAAELGRDGWRMTCATVDPGDHKSESVFSVIIERDGYRAHFTTEYRKGCGLRRWKTDAARNYSDGAPLPGLNVEPGERIPHVGPYGIRPTIAVLEHVNAHSEPEPPTLDEVLNALVMDCSSVRNGETFDDWAGDFGYDTDSRKAEATYRACVETSRALTRLGADFDALEKLFADY